MNQARDLAQRLKRLGLLPGQGQAHRAAAAPSRNEAQHLPVPGRLVRNALGSFILREQCLPLDQRHGQGVLGQARTAPSEALAVLGRLPEYARVSPEKRLYLDTETSSLNRGAGIFVFLVGVGSFEGRGFVVRQFFMRDPTEEPALLLALSRFLAPFQALVSFHGKAFDGPRIRDRFLFHGQDEDAMPPLHLDLYHAARRLFEGRFEDCRLQTLERGLLGFFRSQDLPGAACPAAWFAYQRGGANRIAEIMEHNLLDILSLLALEARLARSLTEPEEVRERLVAGVLAHEAGAWDQAARLLGRVSCVSPLALTIPWGLRVVRAQRALGLQEKALELLEGLGACHGPEERLLRARAMVLEHDLACPGRALRLAEEALELLPEEGCQRPAWERRRRRLCKRLCRPPRAATGAAWPATEGRGVTSRSRGRRPGSSGAQDPARAGSRGGRGGACGVFGPPGD